MKVSACLAPAVLNRLLGMTLFGNSAPVVGSVMLMEPKSPPRISSVGTTAEYVELPEFPLRCRELSHPPKKKVLFCRIGPPILAPNWFWIFVPFLGLKNGRELSTVLRRNS